MKVTLLMLGLSVLVSACGIIPVKYTVDEGHARIENYSQITDRVHEHVYLMCHLKRQTAFRVAEQYPAGKHDLWVKAVIGEPGRPFTKLAFVNFDVMLEEGKSYSFNQKIDDSQISIWLQDQQSGEVVSDIKTQDLKLEDFVGNLRQEQCEQGTV